MLTISKLLICVILLLQGSILLAEDIIKFGIMKVGSDCGSYIVKETLIIPLKLKDTGFRWGYTIESTRQSSLHIPQRILQNLFQS